jgi:two-component system, sensor histidine kinase and response regulator
MKRILVIEDNPHVQDNIHDILSLEDFYTIMASDGSQGLRLAQEEKPDLIICDIMLPQLNGYEVLSALRQDPATESIPFIFLTAMADRSDLRQGMVLGADDYLPKPFTPDELRQAIATRLTRQASQAQQVQRRIDELRDTIAYALPHELNTPLVGIINGARLLRTCYKTMDEEEVNELLDGIESSGNRLYSLIQNFMTYTNLELIAADPKAVAELRTAPANCLPSPIIKTVAHRQAQEANRTADLQIELQDAFITLSERRLKKAVEEVINNAFKFSEPGTPVKVISSVKAGHFHLFVIDQGRGMAAEQVKALGAYMQFQRKLHEQPGSGLGLAIARQIVELYGGELAIESFLGQQTTVRITLPTALHDLLN